MRLDIRTNARWRPMVAFSVSDVGTAMSAGANLVKISAEAGEPAEARILDGQGVVVLAMIAPLGWTVPRAAEGYTWVP